MYALNYSWQASKTVSCTRLTIRRLSEAWNDKKYNLKEYSNGEKGDILIRCKTNEQTNLREQVRRFSN